MWTRPRDWTRKRGEKINLREIKKGRLYHDGKVGGIIQGGDQIKRVTDDVR